MTNVRFATPITQLENAMGIPLAGGQLFFYQTGTQIFKNTYSDAGLTTPNPNPVVADAAGRFGDIFLESGVYAVFLKDVNNVDIWDADPVQGDIDPGLALPSITGPADFGKTIQVNVTGDGYELTSTLNRSYIIADAAGGGILKIKDEGAATPAAANPYISFGYSSTVGGVYNELARIGKNNIIDGDIDINNLTTTGDVNITTTGAGNVNLNPGSGGFVQINGIRASGITYGAITGMLPSTIAGTNTTASLTVSIGQATDSTNAYQLTLSSTRPWAVSNGNAANGYQGGTTLPNSSIIHFYVIGKSDLSSFDTFASTSLTPTLPATYSGGFYRRIFSIPTSAAGALLVSNRVFEAEGGSYYYWYNTAILDISITNLSTSYTQYTLTVPSGFAVQPFYRVNTPTASAAVMLFAGDEGATSSPAYSTNGFTVAPGYDITALGVGGTSNVVPQKSEGITTDTSGRIAAISTIASTAVYWVTRGYKDFRR